MAETKLNNGNIGNKELSTHRGTTSTQRSAEESEHISNGFATDLGRHNLLSYTTHGAFPDVLPNEAGEEFKDFPKGLFAPPGGRDASENLESASHLIGYEAGKYGLTDTAYKQRKKAVIYSLLSPKCRALGFVDDLYRMSETLKAETDAFSS